MPENLDLHTSGTDRAALTAKQSPSPALRSIVALAGCLLIASATTACGGASTENPKAAGTPAAAKAVNADSATTANQKAAQIVTRGADDAFPGLYAHLSGTLVVTEDKCVAVTTAKNAEPTPIAWGHGWSAREENGKTAVYDADGKLFAREGDKVGLAGGNSDRFAGRTCVTGSVFEANDAQTAS